jgi:hypothetical protein
LEHLVQLELYLLRQLLALTLRGDWHTVLVEVPFAIQFVVVLRVLCICCILKELDDLFSGQIISNAAYLTL